jgi:hypothetical protein
VAHEEDGYPLWCRWNTSAPFAQSSHPVVFVNGNIDANERLILTNYHVVANMHELVVFFPIYENKKPVVERERYTTILKESTKSPEDLLRAELIATDPTRDVAL